ncbi:MAG TPA: thioredoxin family protein [Candidatus Thalassarchaeaceae archaeon]|nr:MAG TPA: thioredoxin family protein [Candidatus Poseidoniales archaeon]HII49107.1 thioredoxin family protein [Candidatus Thalassarchaeaceae archaeon]|tara:strand:- start:18 stop:566 length:549 start_codon:yes stop_codon:yes gene_type:complete
MTSELGLEPGDQAADFTLKNANLNAGPDTMKLADVVGDSGGIIVFTCNHCPYVIASESRIENMATRCRSVGIGFVGINSNDPIVYANDDWDHMVDRAESMSYPYLHDSDQTIAHAYGAQRTPEFYLLDGSSKIIYRGRMDDSPRDPNSASTNELDDALNALITGGIVQTPRTESIGCSVKWK